MKITKFLFPSNLIGRDRTNTCFRLQFDRNEVLIKSKFFNYLCDNYGECIVKGDTFINDNFSMNERFLIVESEDIFNDLSSNFDLPEYKIVKDEITALVETLIDRFLFCKITEKLKRKISQKISEKVHKHWSEIRWNDEGLSFKYKDLNYKYEW